MPVYLYLFMLMWLNCYVFSTEVWGPGKCFKLIIILGLCRNVFLNFVEMCKQNLAYEMIWEELNLSKQLIYKKCCVAFLKKEKRIYFYCKSSRWKILKNNKMKKSIKWNIRIPYTSFFVKNVFPSQRLVLSRALIFYSSSYYFRWI